MSIISLTSVGTSPGVTSTAIALTLEWPKPAVLIEADTSKPSSVISGYMRGSVSAERGMNTLLQVSAFHGLDQTTFWDATLPLVADMESVPERHNKHVLTAISNPEAAEATVRFWGELTAVLTGLENAGIDVIVDLGRWSGTNDPRNSLMARSDWVLLCVRRTIQSTAALHARIETVNKTRSSQGHTGHHSILGFSPVSGGHPINELSRFLGTQATGSIPFSPRWGSVFSDGRLPPTGLHKGAYLQSIRSAIGSTEKHLQAVKKLLDQTASEMTHDA